jgi:hypothetical protein
MFLLGDLSARGQAFVDALRTYLLALGHSAMRRLNPGKLTLDDQYTPLLDGRRLQALGSASDNARFIGASLALAAPRTGFRGFIRASSFSMRLFSQNPDKTHHDLFLAFLEKQLARQKQFQTVIFT